MHAYCRWFLPSICRSENGQGNASQRPAFWRSISAGPGSHSSTNVNVYAEQSGSTSNPILAGAQLKYLWIRVALTERSLDQIALFLVKHSLYPSSAFSFSFFFVLSGNLLALFPSGNLALLLNKPQLICYLLDYLFEYL